MGVWVEKYYLPIFLPQPAWAKRGRWVKKKKSQVFPFPRVSGRWGWGVKPSDFPLVWALTEPARLGPMGSEPRAHES